MLGSKIRDISESKKFKKNTDCITISVIQDYLLYIYIYINSYIKETYLLPKSKR